MRVRVSKQCLKCRALNSLCAQGPVEGADGQRSQKREKTAGGAEKAVRGVPRWRGRFVQYGIKVSFWGSGTLKIVIYVENYPQKRCFWLADYHPLRGGGSVN